LTQAALASPRSGSGAGQAVVSFDVNYRPALWPQPPGKLLRDLADRADIVFAGLDEARALWGPEVLTAADVRSLLPSPRILVVKDGAAAATAFDDHRATVVPARRIAVVEPVGAGDAFAAGFLAALLRGDAIERSLRLGHLTAASALAVTGDHGPLPAAEVRQRLLTADAAAWASSEPVRGV
jgi:2-dehydro-3-deoxygluconokinase